MTSDSSTDRCSRSETDIEMWGLFAAVSVLWGLPYLFNEIALRTMGPLWIAAARAVVASVVLSPLLLRHSRWRRLTGRWRELVLVAGAEVALPFSLIALGQRDVSSGTTGVLIATEPIFVAIIGLGVTRGRGVRLRVWLGLGTGLTGVSVVLGIHLDSASALLIVLAALSYATGATLISRMLSDIDPSTSAAAMVLTATPMLVAVALIFEPYTPADGRAAVAVLLLGLACSGGGFSAFFLLIRRAGPTTAATTTFTSPIVALLAGLAFLSEGITISQVAGCALILIGAGLVLRNGSLSGKRSVVG